MIKLRGATGVADCNLGAAVAAVEANYLVPAVNVNCEPYFNLLKTLLECWPKIIAPLQPELKTPFVATPTCPLP